MANEIKLKRGSGSNPSASDLVVGEVALRTDNGKLFTKKDDNSVTEIGSGISDGDKGDITISSSGATFTIDNGVVTSSKLADNSCTSAKILDGAVGTSKLGGSAVTNAKVASDAAIAGSKIAAQFDGQDITGRTLNLTHGTPTLGFISNSSNPDYMIQNLSGALIFQDTTNSVNRLVINTDGHVDVTGNLDVGAGLDVTGEITGTSHIDLPDDAKLKLGTGDDIEIYHNGSNSFLDNSNGNLEIRSNEVRIKDLSEGDNMIYASRDGEVRLYFAGSEKLNTTSSGIDVTGNIVVSGTVDGIDLQTLNTAVAANTAKVSNATHTGDVTGSTALTIANDAVTLAKMQNVITDIILGRTTSGSGNIEVLSAASVRGIINVEDGATADQTASEILTLIKTVDGSGSGLDADTLDGISSASFLRSDENDSMAGNLTLTGNAAGEGVFVSIENSSSAPAGVHLKSGHGNWSVYNSKTIADHLELRDESSNTTVMTLNPLHDLGMGDGTNVRTQITSDHSDAANASNRRGFHVTDGPALCHGGGGNASDRCFEAWSAHGGQAGSNFAKTAFQVLSDGSVKSKNNSYGQISDEKLKQDIVDSPSQWNDIKAVKVKKFRFKEEVTNLGEDKAVTQIGVVAQDLEAAGMNGLVYNTPDVIDNVDQGTVTKSVKYSVLNIKAIKALQEAMTRIETLESEVATLKAG